MSNGHTSHLSPFIRRGAPALAASLLAGLLLVPGPGAAEPDGAPDEQLTIAQAERRIDLLNHEAEIASEKLNAARVRLTAATERLRTLEADVRRQRIRVEELRTEVVGSALADYSGAAGLSTTTSFLVADDPNEFLQGVASQAVADSQQSGLLTQLSQQQRLLAIREQQAGRELAVVTDHKEALAASKVQLDRKVEQAEAVLHELKVKERKRLARVAARQAARAQARTDARIEARVEARASRSEQRVGTAPAPAPATTPAPAPAPEPASVPYSGRGAAAVSYALAQVGDPYVYGAAGPDAFDCSGLTMAAWAAAGVSIPHASSMQPGAGTPVSISSLMPGDLVFYYSPISHVGLYIGNGQLVHAANPSLPVHVTPVNSMPIAMAVRIG